MKKTVAPFLLFAVIANLIIGCGTSAQQSEIVVQPTFELLSMPNESIIFAGKVVNPNNGNWENNRLVVLFLNSKEIARAVTFTGENTYQIHKYYIDPNNNSIGYGGMIGWVDKYVGRADDGLGIADGIFIISVLNTYELNLENLGVPPEQASFVQVQDSDSNLGVLVNTFDFNEGDRREYYIPSKNLRYILIALAGDVSQLPQEIQQVGSLRLLDGNRLVAINPNESKSTPQPFSGATRFEQVTESVNELSNSVFPINNCGGTTDIKQEITHTYIHEIIDESSEKLGIEVPLLDWLKIVAEVGHKYGTTDKEITTYSTTLTVPAGKNIEYTVLRKQIWESGVAIMNNNGIEISAAYRILKNETFEVANSEQKTCP